jgi:hypothetical protein
VTGSGDLGGHVGDDGRAAEQSRHGSPANDIPSIGTSSAEAAPRHDTMHMRMMGEGLSPGMQNGDHAAFSSEVAGIGTNELPWAPRPPCSATQRRRSARAR